MNGREAQGSEAGRFREEEEETENLWSDERRVYGKLTLIPRLLRRTGKRG